MNAPFKQEDRRARLATSLGKDVLVLLRMDGTEELSGDFEWRVEALSASPTLDLDDLLGTHATITMDTNKGPRYFDGIVAEARRLGAEENGNRYNLVLRPWLHVASLRRNQRIFHNLTVAQILSELFGAYSGLGEPHFELRLTADYPVLEYTVQYAESDAAFATRMMERFGITWHWVHKAGMHILVLTDEVTNHPDVPGDTRPFYGVDKTHQADHEHFREWFGGSRMTTGAVRLTEYNFKIPNSAQEVERSSGSKYDHGQIESFDWPGDYLTQDVGKTVVAKRIEAEEGQGLRVLAKGDVASLGAGLCVTLTGEKLHEATGRRFFCLKAHHQLRTQAYGSTQTDSEDRDYDGSYVLVPDTAPFRPERRTPCPVIHGPQTARVVGEGEIDCDEYGRILVRFHWDLHDRYSMRCRVSQNWASNRWGGMIIPRIGMEVVVEFLEGDPDKPLVTGCVYNGKNMPPHELPKHKTRSTFKTDTHKGRGFNELRFEDENGREEVFLQAQQDRVFYTKLNAMEHIGASERRAIGANRHTDVGLNETRVVGGDFKLTVGSKAAMSSVLQSLSFSELKSRGVTFPISTVRALGDALAQVKSGAGNLRLFLTGSRIAAIAQEDMLQVKGNRSKVVDGAQSEIIQGTDESYVTEHRIQKSQAKTHLISDDSFTIECGKSRIVLHPDGQIEIVGSKISVNGSDHISAQSRRIDLN